MNKRIDLRARSARRGPAFALIALLLCTSGCSCPEILDEPLRDLSKLNVHEATALFSSEERMAASLSAGAVARFWTPDKEPPPVDAVVLVRRPDLFRMQAFPRPIGPMIFDLSITADTVRFYVRDENTLFIEKMGRQRKGPGPEKKVKGPDLDSVFGKTGLASMFLGTPLEAGQELRFVERSDEGLKIAVIDSDGTVTGYAWLEEVTLFKRKQVVFGEGGKPSLVLLFSDYVKLDASGAFWPMQIAIEAPEDRLKLLLKFDEDDIILNEPIAREMFDMDLPDDVKLVERQ